MGFSAPSECFEPRAAATPTKPSRARSDIAAPPMRFLPLQRVPAHSSSIMSGLACPERLRPQVFSTSRRVSDPPRACRPCFMPDPLMGFRPSEPCSRRVAVRRLRRRSPPGVGPCSPPPRDLAADRACARPKPRRSPDSSHRSAGAEAPPDETRCPLRAHPKVYAIRASADLHGPEGPWRSTVRSPVPGPKTEAGSSDPARLSPRPKPRRNTVGCRPLAGKGRPKAPFAHPRALSRARPKSLSLEHLRSVRPRPKPRIEPNERSRWPRVLPRLQGFAPRDDPPLVYRLIRPVHSA
jgi:hypothetical protein